MMMVISSMDKLDALSTATKNFIAAAAIFVLTLAAYSNSFHSEFHYDDLHQIVENNSVRGLSNIPGFFREPDMGSYLVGAKGYRPVTYSSFAVNYAISGYKVWSYHLFNFILHFLNAFMVFLLIGYTIKSTGREGGFLPALTASLVFAVHPIQTYAVTYVSGRAVLLASFFYLVAFLAFIRYRSGAGGRASKYLLVSTIPILYLLGLLSKEMAVSLPVTMLAYDLLITAPERKGRARSFHTWLPHMSLLLVLAGYILYKKRLMGYAAAQDLPYGAFQYLMSEAKALLMYVRLLLLPVNQNIDYRLPLTTASDALVVLSWLMTGLAIWLLFRARKEYAAVSFFGFWFFITLAPESTLVPIYDIAAEYRLYLPSAGFIAALVVLAPRVIKAPARRALLAGAVVVLLCLLTAGRNAVWATEYTLWSDVIKKTPGSYSGYINRGKALFADRQYFESIKDLKKAVEFAGTPAEVSKVHNNMGLCYMSLEMDEDAADEFRKAIAADSELVEAYDNLGMVYYGLGRYGEAAVVLGEGIALNPGYGPDHAMLAGTYAKLGRYAEALSEMKEACRLSPKDFNNRCNMAVIYMCNGMPDEALREAMIAAGLAGDDKERAQLRDLMGKLKGNARRPRMEGMGK